MEILLISPDAVKNITVISDNTDEKYLLSSIREAQTIDFQQIIGSDLYFKLLELVESGDIDENEYEEYKLLLESAKYFLAYKVAEKLILNTTYKISNIGLNTTADEYVQIPQIKDVLRVRDEYTHKCDYYKLLLQKLLYSFYKQGLLKELGECNFKLIETNLYSAASTNIWLGGARGRGFWGRCWRRKHWH